MMKKNILKYFAVLLTLLMLFALASCDEKNKNQEKNRPENTGTAENAEKNGTDGKTDSDEKQTADKPSGTNDHTTNSGKQEETTSAEPGEKDYEGEFVIPPEGIHLPVVPLK